MQRLSLAAAALAACTFSLSAQGTSAVTISPKGAATSSGNTNNNIPYSWFPTRYQQIFNHDSFSHGTTPFLVREIDYRMNKSFANGRYGGQTVELSAWLARAPAGTNATNFSSTFANNIDKPTKTLVINRKKFLAPKLANQNFDFKLKLDTPATIIPSTRRAVVLEVIVWSNTNGNRLFVYPLDAARSTLGTGIARVYAYESTPGGGKYTQQGTYNGCANSNNRIVRQYASAGNIKVGGTGGYTYAYGYIANVPALGILGANPVNVPLPGNCKLVNDIIVVFPGTGVGSFGRHRVNFNIPNVPALAGVAFLYQTFFVDRRANSLGLVSTRGIRVTIGTGKATPPDQYKTATGSTSSYGLITQFVN